MAGSVTMPLERIVSRTAIFLLAVAALPARPGLPRPSPQFTLTQPSGSQIELSSFKGKVVAIEFLFVRSPHCLELAKMLNKIYSELGSRGFQAVAVAFGPSASESVVTNLVEYFKLTYPVGYTSPDKVDAFLGREGTETLKIPQMVVIDRNGDIRALSGSEGNPTLENESSLRALIYTLLSGR
jgi:peroxiredoxin